MHGGREQAVAESAYLLWKEPGAQHLFEEPGALETIDDVSGERFASPLVGGTS